MCPELIRVFALDDHADFITAAWDEINLHTITRGISRFESVRLVFDRLKNRGIESRAARILPPGSIPRRSFHGQPAAGAAKDRQPGPAQAAGGTTPATAAVFRRWSRRLSRSPAWRKACASCTPWPMWPSSVPRTRAPLPASGSATGWPVMRMSSSGQEVGSKANSIATMLALRV